MDIEFLHKENLFKISLNKKDGRIVATLGDEKWEVDVHFISSNRMSFLIGSRSLDVYLAKAGGKMYVSVNGENYCFTSPDEEDDLGTVRRGETTVETELTITAPMPGSVLKVNVKEGDKVEEGQCLVIVEAMKMETGLHSAIRGEVKKIHAIEGKQVDAGEVLIELEEI